MGVEERPVIGLTVGDPAGVGPEIVVKALADRTSYDVCRPVVYADRVVLEQALDHLGAGLQLNEVARPADGRFALPCGYHSARV